MTDFISQNGMSFLAFGIFVLLVSAWVGWESHVRAMLIRRSDITRLADELVQQHGERAEEIAFIEEDRSWRYSRNFEKGKWRRVRTELSRRRKF
ncbi:hypothetical protein ACQZ5D_01990 [Agrobacterium sp. 22-211-1]|uniref:hypothetical protein n=1 Tax=Agrobacterium tomkonis TaxID=1183410 RepID=UPI001CD9C757|nr:hypothetical protein [Agrobacterium tomkonis RTP8]